MPRVSKDLQRLCKLPYHCQMRKILQYGNARGHGLFNDFLKRNLRRAGMRVDGRVSFLRIKQNRIEVLIPNESLLLYFACLLKDEEVEIISRSLKNPPIALKVLSTSAEQCEERFDR